MLTKESELWLSDMHLRFSWASLFSIFCLFIRLFSECASWILIQENKHAVCRFTRIGAFAYSLPFKQTCGVDREWYWIWERKKLGVQGQYPNQNGEVGGFGPKTHHSLSISAPLVYLTGQSNPTIPISTDSVVK